MTDLHQIKTPSGFLASGTACGIKSSAVNDIALFASSVPCSAAALFTTNKVKAAPIRVSQDHLTISRATARAVLISSGNANAATGERGLAIARDMCSEVSKVIGCATEQILIAQTGLIGVPLHPERTCEGAKSVATSLSAQGWEEAARGMMTTDTHPKWATCEMNIGGKKATLSGFGKGVAMASPAMATMLVVLLTDVEAAATVLQSALRNAAEDSFHQLNIDGCRSTNDTVFLLANGESGAEPITFDTKESLAEFQNALRYVCRDLALQMAGDAEGRHKRMTVKVRGALTLDDARRVARQVVGSVLVKCAVAGGCPYWGRVIAEVGASGAHIDPENVSISFGPYLVCRASTALEFDREIVAHYMSGADIDITVDLHVGAASAEAFGSDLTHEYLRINMEKS